MLPLLRLRVLGLSGLALPRRVLAGLAFAMRLLAVELSATARPTAAFLVLGLLFGVLAVLGRIFEVLVESLLGRSSRVVGLLSIVALTLVVSVAPGLATTALLVDRDVALLLQLAVSLRGGVGLDFVALFIGLLFVILLVPTSALAFAVVMLLAIPALGAEGPAAEVVARSVVVVVARLSLVGHGPNRGLFRLWLVFLALGGARKNGGLRFKLYPSLPLSLTLVDFLPLGLVLAILRWPVVAVVTVVAIIPIVAVLASIAALGLAFVPWLLGALDRLRLVICPELQLFVLVILALLFFLLLAFFFIVVLLGGEVAVADEDSLIFDVVDNGVELGGAEGHRPLNRREILVARDGRSLVIDLEGDFHSGF